MRVLFRLPFAALDSSPSFSTGASLARDHVLCPRVTAAAGSQVSTDTFSNFTGRRYRVTHVADYKSLEPFFSQVSSCQQLLSYHAEDKHENLTIYASNIEASVIH